VRAWSRFLRASLERSRATRRQRPQLARQARTWGVSGAAAWVATCRAGRGIPGFDPHPAAGLAWWLAVSRMLEWHLGMAEEDDARPRTRLSPADAVSLGRLWLVPLLPAVSRSSAGLPALIALGASSDALDGALARRRGPTRLGRDLDTTADVAFLAAAALSARAADRIAPPCFWALVLRQAVGVTISLGSYFGDARSPRFEARRWAAVARASGLTACVCGHTRVGMPLVAIGCIAPPATARAAGEAAADTGP